MSNLYDTIVIGAGQAGLASAYYLQRARSRFLVLDGGGRIGESWLRRWDSLRLFTPVRYNSLPGLPFPGEPYALPVKDAVARYLEAYVEHFALPVRLNTRVSSLVRNADHFVVTTEGETFTTRNTSSDSWSRTTRMPAERRRRTSQHEGPVKSHSCTPNTEHPTFSS